MTPARPTLNPDYQALAACADAPDALSALRALPPDLVREALMLGIAHDLDEEYSRWPSHVGTDLDALYAEMVRRDVVEEIILRAALLGRDLDLWRRLERWAPAVRREAAQLRAAYDAAFAERHVRGSSRTSSQARRSSLACPRTSPRGAPTSRRGWPI
jgi:hypothetical protein